MIGKPEWFERRKYGGWGLHPRTWQGWAYIAVFLIPFAVFQALPFWDTQTRLYVTYGWLAFLLIDVTHIMIMLKKDEREQKIEALAERNAAWTMMLVIIAGILYQLITTSLQHAPSVDWFLIAALFGGVIAKSVSNIVLERKAI